MFLYHRMVAVHKAGALRLSLKTLSSAKFCLVKTYDLPPKYLPGSGFVSAMLLFETMRVVCNWIALWFLSRKPLSMAWMFDCLSLTAVRQVPKTCGLDWTCLREAINHFTSVQLKWISGQHSSEDTERAPIKRLLVWVQSTPCMIIKIGKACLIITCWLLLGGNILLFDSSKLLLKTDPTELANRQHRAVWQVQLIV